MSVMQTIIPCSVAFQGELGAYSEEAICARWQMKAMPLAQRTFADVINMVRDGFAQYGVLPIENTIVGPISAAREALDLAQSSGAGIDIVDEISLPIRHALLALPGATLDELTHVASHPAALRQCRRFFEQHPRLTPVESYDTAGAAREIAREGQPHIGAIAGARAADMYNLQILAEEIQDMPDNQTRFVVIANTRGDRW